VTFIDTVHNTKDTQPCSSKDMVLVQKAANKLDIVMDFLRNCIWATRN
jgi:hypothetical protein